MSEPTKFRIKVNEEDKTDTLDRADRVGIKRIGRVKVEVPQSDQEKVDELFASIELSERLRLLDFFTNWQTWPYGIMRVLASGNGKLR